MKLSYDQEVDILVIQLNAKTIADSDEIAPGVIADFDAEGNFISLEILDASRQVDSLHDT